MKTLTLRLRGESGIALVMALMMISVLTIVGGTMVVYSTQGQHESNRSKASDVAYRLAETGVNNAAAVLGLPTNNALSQSTLSSTEPSDTDATYSGAYEGGRAKWWGVFNSTSKVWTLYGKGVVTNPSPNSGPVRRTVSATMQVSYSYNQPLNTQAWNYVYFTNKGGANVCDVTLQNNMQLDAPLYLEGNLCFSNNTNIREDLATPRVPISVVVKGKVQWANNGSSIGISSSNTVNSVYIAGGCGTALNSVHVCKAYPTSGYDPIYAGAGGFSTTTPNVSAPTVNWASDGWYANSDPGPAHACTTVAGTPPLFDGGSSPYNTQQNLASPYANGSIPSTVNLTPASSYTCRSAGGELSWNSATGTMTIRGVIYIDGNVSIGNGNVLEYNGQATMWVSGYVSINGSMCGKRNVGNTDCDFASWNPNTEMWIIAAHGNDGTGNSITFPNNAKWEGGLYATNGINLSNNVQVEGPMIAGTAVLSNNVIVKPFPTITTVPTGAPGNPNVYAQPNPPGGYSG
jgi:Tfp pilus assembly protein PilX